MAIWDEIKESFKQGSIITRIIYINIAVFIFLRLADVVFKLFMITATDWNYPLYLVSAPSNIALLAAKPWTVITYMFTHFGFFHILFNMLVFYWFAQLFLSFYNSKQLLGLYITGGIAGAMVYFLFFNLLPFYEPRVGSSGLMGASASVLAIVVATAVTAPNMQIRLFLIGVVKLKYLALFSIIVDLLSITAENAGGHLAHLGGTLWGFVFVASMQKGIDPVRWVQAIVSFFQQLFTPRPKTNMKVKWNRPRTDQEFRDERVKNEQEINNILEKIKKSGYDSLSKEEKQKLFNAGNN
jgi:membrane associated rhomboid family serine protease